MPDLLCPTCGAVVKPGQVAACGLHVSNTRGQERRIVASELRAWMYMLENDHACADVPGEVAEQIVQHLHEPIGRFLGERQRSS